MPPVDSATPAPTSDRGRDALARPGAQPPALVFVAVLLALGALYVAQPVAMPLAFALFLVGLFWPLQRRFVRVMPTWAALCLNLLVLTLAVAAFVGLLWLCAQRVAGEWAPYQDQLARELEGLRAWASERGLPLPGASGEASASGAPGSEGVGGLLPSGLAGAFASYVFSAGGLAVLAVAFFVLATLEVGAFARKLRAILPRRDADDAGASFWLAKAHHAATEFSAYFAVRTAVGAITGVATGLFCFAVGLDFALIWGVTNFLLNYVPTLGSLIGIAPPVLFALVQFGPLGALGVLAGVGGVQLFMGQVVGPIFQGRVLDLSALVVLVSVAFWGWMWGIAGAFIGVPIAVAVVVACRQTERYAWVATLLAEHPDDDDA